ncbi:eukaryotic translation initiation factor 4E class II [Flagelloscypha sp. PMI_526]|nr:eukaryotic translation initiation factor 4E class II [Flagelloscypha sp. PMI_526]
MTGYFSNQSQARFLPSTTSSTSTVSAQPASANPRPRLPSSASSSRHFSTTVNTNTTASSNGTGGLKMAKSRESLASKATTDVTVHPLRYTWIFWFRQQRSPGNKIVSYEEGIKRISAFSSVENFMNIYSHLTLPSQLQPTTDYLLFHSQIQRPIWEDPLNITGGKWIVRLKKGVADRIWEDLCFAVVGDQLSSNADDEAEFPEICGCTISVRQHEDIISLWNRVETDVALRDRIRDNLRKILNLPAATVMEYKTNNDSMQDKSSFRTTPATPIS